MHSAPQSPLWPVSKLQFHTILHFDLLGIKPGNSKKLSNISVHVLQIYCQLHK